MPRRTVPNEEKDVYAISLKLSPEHKMKLDELQRLISERIGLSTLLNKNQIIEIVLNDAYARETELASKTRKDK